MLKYAWERNMTLTLCNWVRIFQHMFSPDQGDAQVYELTQFTALKEETGT